MNFSSSLDKALEPFPFVFRVGPPKWRPWTAGGITLAGLYGVMQAARLSTGNPWKGDTLVFNWADPCLALGAAAVASALRDCDIETSTAFYHAKAWYLSLAGAFLAINVGMEARNIQNGMPWRKELETGQLTHFLLMPIWGAILVGTLPHVFRDVEGKTRQRLVIACVFAFYSYALATSMSQGSLA